MKAFTGRYRFRLLIGLPLVVICFTMAAGFLPIGMFDYSLARAESPAELRTLALNLRIAVLIITLVATSLAVALSLHIVRPVERIINELEAIARRHGQDLPPKKAGVTDEIDRLAQLYNQTFVPMQGYLTTADLFLQMSEGIVSLNADGKIAFLNEPIERLLAISRQDYMGKHYGELFTNRNRNIEIYELIEEVLHHGAVRTRDILLSTPAGLDVYVRATASPATGRGNQAIGVVMLFQDIEELGRLRDKLRQMDVLASIGSTIAGMAHEVKTPLGYVRGLTELIKEDLPKDAPQQVYIQKIVEAIDRLNLMVQDILSLASVKVDKSADVDPVSVARECVMYVRDIIRDKDLNLVEDYPAITHMVKADRHKLSESFLNILRNGCEAAPNGAKVSIRVRHVTVGHGTSNSQDTLIIDFHNEGSFIPPATKEKLFTPFFTTKKQGTGLGLAITKQIIEAHGGAIHVESEAETGTLFRILVPVAAPSERSTESAVK